MNKFKFYILDAFFIVLSIVIGAAIIYLGDMLLGINLEVFQGIIGTFTPLWIVDLIVLPFVAGIAVSGVYGLGGKIWAYFPPLLVRIPAYLNADPSVYGTGASVLPFGYWILILIVTVEACGLGGIVGEVIIKKTYGRSPKPRFHKRHQADQATDLESH